MPRDYFTSSIAPQDRARQFIPFMALKGYFDLCLEQERRPQPRHVLTEEEALALSQIIASLHKGSMAKVMYYDEGAYVTKQGMVSEVVPELRFLRIVRARIDFDDILEIECLDGDSAQRDAVVQ